MRLPCAPEMDERMLGAGEVLELVDIHSHYQIQKANTLENIGENLDDLLRVH